MTSFTIHPESPNKRGIPLVEEIFGVVEPRIRELLPELPNDLKLYVHSETNIPETGSGGFAYDPTTISLSVDNDFEDKDLQKKSLREAIFHESFHVVQGHTGFDASAEYDCALDSAIYEGCATIFEREYAGAKPLWGDYSMHNEKELNSWRDALSKIHIADWRENKDEVRQDWSFYDPNDKRRWKVYKVGAWLVDEYLKKNDADILDLRYLSAKEIRDDLIK